MYYRLSLAQEKELLNKPETGMGYQIIIAVRPGTTIREKFVVLNAELAIELNDAAPLCVKQVATEGIDSVSAKAPAFRWEIEEVMLHDSTLKPNSPAANSKTESTDGGEIFVRRSIYLNDKRIDTENNSLRPGSFTTTFADSLRHRNSSEDPLIQLAMDHGVRGKWGYHIQPKRSDTLQRGHADPRTGAKEIYFQNGTSFDTFIRKETY